MSEKKKDAGPVKKNQKQNVNVKTGLTLKERKRMQEIKSILSGKNRKREVPDTTQETIKFKKMYPDGICQVTSTYYTKMVEFYDINYDMLDDDDQLDVLSGYCDLLNFFEPDVHYEIMLFNRQISEQVLVDKVNIQLQDDDADDIREEFADMLKTVMAKGKNGIVKSKYLIFGIEAKTYNDAKARLESIEIGVVKNLIDIGTPADVLSGKERLRVLHEYFNQDAKKPFFFSYKEMATSGNSVKDYIAPPGFDFRNPNRFKSGNMYGSVYYFDAIAPKFYDTLMKKLLDINDNITITVHLQNKDQVEAVKMVKGALSDVQKMKIDEQKKAVRGGYDMDILPPDIVTYEKDTLNLIDSLNNSNKKITMMSFFITCYGKTKKELEALTQRVTGIVQQANCDMHCLQYCQEQGLMASAPIGCNETGLERMMTTDSVAVLVPFCTQELFMAGEALYYGLNPLSNNMIMADRKKLRTPNGMILGTPGSGKSFSAKREILGSYLMTRDDILICDPEAEYAPLVYALHGSVIKLATNSTNYLNPMDIQKSHISDKEALRLKSDFLITLCDKIAGGEKGLENDEKGIIDQCIEKVYESYFKNPTPENMPILEDLYNALLRYEPKNVEKELAVEAKEKAVRIAQNLVLYVHGSQNYFNHRTNVDSQNRIMCFDIKELSNQLHDLGMLIVQDAVWNRVSQNRERKIATRYYCDEFHRARRSVA